MAHYLDTSALVKLVVNETETPALRSWLSEQPRDPVTCDLTRTELVRAVRRVAPDRVVAARDVLDALTILRLPTQVFDAAAALAPATLRSLDAIHLGSALTLGDDLDAVVSYDERLSAAAAALGVRTLAPGAGV